MIGVLLDRTVPWVAYPVTMLLAMVLHVWMPGSGQSVVLSAYLPVFLGAIMVTCLEIGFPNEIRWRPTRNELGQDVLYMVVVQMLLPKLLALGLALALIDRIGQRPTWNLWPQDLPVAAQAVIMLLIADFLRYWLHRAAHNVSWLWRLHAVHHSPQRLYWVNVGRFHPIEKVLQFLFDTLPFILVGVSEQVVALYFVFYAINGFFQHSNIKLHYGVLNYLISSAELHRWHHSRLTEESNTNYGNNVIIWDLLFGTRFLPSDKTVGELGLKNRTYPGAFLDELVTPFVEGIAEQHISFRPFRIRFQALLFRWRMRWIKWLYWQPLMRAAGDPTATQDRLLTEILQRECNTRYGAEHQFALIQSYSDFISHVPIQDYESLRPYIEAQERGEAAALTVETPFMYAVTSGTTGEPKFLPVLESTLAQYREGQAMFTLILHDACPAAFEGKAFGVASPAVEGYRPSGKPYGSVSGQLYASMPHRVQAQYVIPPVVYAIQDHALKYNVMLRLALAEPDITYFAGANPSSFLKLLSILNEYRAEFIDSLALGGMQGLGQIDDELLTMLNDLLQPCPDRADVLRQTSPDTALTFEMLWPRLRLMTVWTGGSCGVALNALKRNLSNEVQIVDLGYLASEARLTLTIDSTTGAGLPMLTQHVYEFVERTQWEAGNKQTLRLDELQKGGEYYLIITTQSGLYRYFMNDMVTVVGRFRNTPTIRFLQKGRGVTSITGEKLYEHHMLRAVGESLARHHIQPAFMMALADEQASRYHVYIETTSNTGQQDSGLAAAIDTALGQMNMEYAAKRDSGRLLPPVVHWLSSGAGNAYREYCVANGQREGQFKPLTLQYAAEFAFPLADFLQQND